MYNRNYQFVKIILTAVSIAFGSVFPLNAETFLGGVWEGIYQPRLPDREPVSSMSSILSQEFRLQMSAYAADFTFFSDIAFNHTVGNDHDPQNVQVSIDLLEAELYLTPTFIVKAGKFTSSLGSAYLFSPLQFMHAADMAAIFKGSAGQVLAVTFTSRAAGEMRSRLRAMGVSGVQALTFHAAARRQLSYFWPRVVGDTGWQLMDSKFAVVAQAANRARLQVSTDDVRDLAGEIEWAKASLISPETYPGAVAEAARDIPLDAAKVAAVYAGYEKLKADRDGVALLDFDDLLLHTAAAIEADSAIATEFRDRYRCFVVDEYQAASTRRCSGVASWDSATTKQR